MGFVFDDKEIVKGKCFNENMFWLEVFVIWLKNLFGEVLVFVVEMVLNVIG